MPQIQRTPAHSIPGGRGLALVLWCGLAAELGWNGPARAQDELLPGELPLTIDRELILAEPLPTIRQLIAAVQDPEVRPLAGFRLYGEDRNHYAPSWSADGDSLLCLRSDLNLNTCKLLIFPTLAQREPHEVYSEMFTFEDMPCWTRQPRPLLVFASNNEEEREENIHWAAVERESGAVVTGQITRGEGVKVLPSFHTDGTTAQLVFRRDAELVQVRFPLADPAQAAAASMAEGQEAQLAYDGRYLALVRSQGQDQTLHARDPKTRREILLCDTPGQLIRNATWSPDGKWIAYLSRPHEQLQWELWVCRLSSDPTPTRLVEAVRVDEDFRHVGPAWSPDGDKLWFLRAEGNQGYYPIQWISRDGHRQGTIEYPRGVTTALDLAVGPDARRPALAFSAVRQHAVDVFVLLLNHY